MCVLFSSSREFPGDTRGGYCDICCNFDLSNTMYGWVLVRCGCLYVVLHAGDCWRWIYCSVLWLQILLSVAVIVCVQFQYLPMTFLINPLLSKSFMAGLLPISNSRRNHMPMECGPSSLTFKHILFKFIWSLYSFVINLRKTVESYGMEILGYSPLVLEI